MTTMPEYRVSAKWDGTPYVASDGVPCPKCRVAIDVYCVRPDGQPAYQTHAARQRKVQAANEDLSLGER